MNAYPTALRKLTPEEEKEILEDYNAGKGCDYLIKDLEQIFQMALNSEEEFCKTDVRALSGGYYTLRRITKLLKYLDPFQES